MIGSFRLPISITSGGTSAPTIISAKVEDANPDKLVVVFSEPVNITDVTGLTITGDVTPTLSVPTGSGTDTITFTLSAALTNGQAVTLNVASSNTIEDSASNALAATTKTITNNVVVVTVSIPHDHYYNFDESTGDLIDRKGTANGTLFGSITRQEVGIKNQAYGFNGTNTYISVPELNNEFTGNFSVGIWVKFTTQPVNEDLVRLAQTRGRGRIGVKKGWQISTNGIDYGNTIIDDGSGSGILFEGVPFGEFDSNFHFFTLTFNTSTGEAKFYIDGVLKSSRTNSNLIGVDFTSTDDFEIGRSSNGDQYIDSNQDELYTYKGVWTPTEISDYTTNI